MGVFILKWWAGCRRRHRRLRRKIRCKGWEFNWLLCFVVFDWRETWRVWACRSLWLFSASIMVFKASILSSRIALMEIQILQFIAYQEKLQFAVCQGEDNEEWRHFSLTTFFLLLWLPNLYEFPNLASHVSFNCFCGLYVLVWMKNTSWRP